jgi:hypothetical protein
MLKWIHFYIFINVFPKCHFSILGYVANGFEWGLCSLFKVNRKIVWSMFKQHVSIISFKNIFVCLVLQRNFMLIWPSSCVKITYIKNVYILFTICMKVHAPMNENFYHLGLCTLLRFLWRLRFCVHWSSFGSSSNAPRW